MKKYQNTFIAMLNLLKVKHTTVFSNNFFNEHPHKFNLYGLSRMLSDYRVRNATTRIENKEHDIFNIELPFVAYTGSSFVAVHKVDSDKVHYIWNGKKISIPVSKFIQSWSGVILLADTSSESGEPDYNEHLKKDLLIAVQKSILALAGILILGMAYINDNVYANWGFSLLLLVNLIGIYICYLLVLKQLHIHSRYADKICTLFSKSDCNNVLESDAAKLWGIFGWSEIGLGYFTANIVVLLFLPHLLPWAVLFNILALPYSDAWTVLVERYSFYKIHHGLFNGFPGVQLVLSHIKEHYN